MTLHRNTSYPIRRYTGYEWGSYADFVRHNDALIGLFPRHQENLAPPAQPGLGLR